jgi:hypothetical protein
MLEFFGALLHFHLPLIIMEYEPLNYYAASQSFYLRYFDAFISDLTCSPSLSGTYSYC